MQGLPDNSITRDSWIYQFPGPAIGKVFSGNKELAKSYLGVGMSMLLYVKTSMRNGLLGSLSMNRVLEDGTTIQVNSFYGNDRIIIDAPFQKLEVVEEKRELRFKITGPDGVLGSRGFSYNPGYGPPDFGYEVSFSIYFPDPSENTGYREESVRQRFDPDTGYWTISRPSLENPYNGTWDPGTAAPVEAFLWDYNDEGEMYESDEVFWVRYGGTLPTIITPTSITEKEIIETQYDGLADQSKWFQEKDLISPGDYDDNVAIKTKITHITPETVPVKFLFTCNVNGRPASGTVAGHTDDVPGYYTSSFISHPPFLVWEITIYYFEDRIGTSSGAWIFSGGGGGRYPKYVYGIPVPGPGEISGPHDVSLWYFEGGSGPNGSFMEGDTPDTNLGYTYYAFPSPIFYPFETLPDIDGDYIFVLRLFPWPYTPPFNYAFVGYFLLTDPNS